MTLGKKSSVTSEAVHCYQIGKKYFVAHPITGVLHEIETGRTVTAEERDAYLNYFIGSKKN